MAYMKKVNNAATDSGAGGGWFKIFEDGMVCHPILSPRKIEADGPFVDL
jgi:hypothetical protein